MGWSKSWEDPLKAYLAGFEDLIGDKRTGKTLEAIVVGIIGAGSLVCQQIAAHSPVLATIKHGAQRVIRLVSGESTQRSTLDAEHLTAKLCEQGLEHLSRPQGPDEEPPSEWWLIMDESDLRKPYAQEMPDLMCVRDLDGSLVPGYRTLNVLGVAPKRRGILYHRLFSSEEEGFVSEPREVQRALQQVHQRLEALEQRPAVTWIMDRNFDNVAVWRTIWEHHEHLLCRIQHRERHVRFRTARAEWQEGRIEDALEHMQPLATTRSQMKIRLGSQKRPKMQTVRVQIAACPLALEYDRNVRREGAPDLTCQPLWLVAVTLAKAHCDPWLLLTDRPVTGEAMAIQIFRMYRQRWAVEDAFKYTKDCLGWEEVQVLDLQSIRVLVALAWVAAGFLYQMGVTMEWPEIRLLARLGGWEERADRPPGQIVITRGLAQLLNSFVTQAILQQHIDSHGALPPGIVNLIGSFIDLDL
jgi:hypothetical protein